MSRRLTDVLGIVKRHLSERPELAKVIDYRISKKGSQDASRRSKLLKFKEVDQETLTLLQDNHVQWTQDPTLFWNHFPEAQFSLPTTSVQVVGCYLQALRDNA